ncbi:MAG: hypothetical protein KJZ78_11830 [Bryobacteraceae bacterium]|nr:hypothetical protein [Bryobacteraceae bacterium]
MVTPSTAKATVRLLSVIPVAFGGLALFLAAMFCASLAGEWWQCMLGLSFGGSAVFLFRRAFLIWRRPCRQFVSEVCGWTAFAVLAGCSLAVEQLTVYGYDRIAVGVAAAGLLLSVAVYRPLKRRLLRDTSNEAP